MTTNFPIYLDYQATTPTDERVVESMKPFYFQEFGNPHSVEHSFGWKAESAIDKAREEVAFLISSDADEIIFTSGATEANNLAILGLAEESDRKRHKVFVSAIEHKSVLAPVQRLRQKGFEVALIPVDEVGLVDVEWLKNNIDSQTMLVSVMAVNNELGTIQDLSIISEICHNCGVLLHFDSAQAFPSVRIDVFALDIDFLSLSAHKIYGPKGVGALYVKRELQSKMTPLIWGGEQEGGLRAGTLPTPLCVGFGKAASLMMQDWNQEKEHLISCRNHFFDALKNEIKDLRLIGPKLEQRHLGNLNILLPGINAEAFIGSLQPHLAISTGSACTSGIIGSSHVLSAIGLSRDESNCCIRMGVGRSTSLDDLNTAARLVVDKYNSLRI